MRIKKENHRRILQFLDRFGEVTANGISKSSNEVQQLITYTRKPLELKDLLAITAEAQATNQKVTITANGKRVYIIFS